MPPLPILRMLRCHVTYATPLIVSRLRVFFRARAAILRLPLMPLPDRRFSKASLFIRRPYAAAPAQRAFASAILRCHADNTADVAFDYYDIAAYADMIYYRSSRHGRQYIARISVAAC